MKTRLLSCGLAAFVLGFAAMGCGNGIDTSENAELRVLVEEIELSNVGPSNSNTALQTGLVIENTGRGIMEVQSLEWINKPSRLEAYFVGPLSEADEGISCSTDDECSDGAVCMTVAGNCRDIGFRDLPHQVQPDATFNQDLVLLASDSQVECPEPPAEQDVPDGYCGEIEVRTNAINNGGNARIFVVAAGGSGVMQLPNTYLEFTLAVPGVTQTKNFDIENAGNTPLEMVRANFSQNPGWFSITPALSTVEIAPNQSETFVMEMTPPSEASEADLEFISTVSFESSSTTSEPAMNVEVTAGIGAAPLIEVDPLQLSFADGTTQSFRIYNHGNASLPVNSMELRPLGTIDDYYQVLHEGTDMLASGANVPNIPPATNDGPSFEEFTVEFSAPGDGSSAVGELRINHRDPLADNRSEITLLGAATEVAIGELGPSPVNFRSDGGEQSRTVAIANRGNAALEITGYDLDEVNPQTDAEDFAIDGLDEMILGPGAIGEFTITYTGSNEFNQHLRVIPESNHAGQATLQLNATTANLSPAQMDLTIVPSFPAAASVNELATFSVTDASGVGRLDRTTWTVHARPGGSEATLEGSGEQVGLTPDVAGQYRISVLVDDVDGREVQEFLDFDAQ